MNILKVQNLAEWHNWLVENHDLMSGIWLAFNKKHPGLRYEESIEEARCFGWLDSRIKKIDDEHHARKFTPRKSGSKLYLYSSLSSSFKTQYAV